MSDLSFVWDKRKNSSNEKKHQISFEEAKTVFYDEFARLIFDPEHCQDEDRYILLGLRAQLRCLVVCHCCRESEQTIRIISARKATKSESKQYEEIRHER